MSPSFVEMLRRTSGTATAFPSSWTASCGRPLRGTGLSWKISSRPQIAREQLF